MKSLPGQCSDLDEYFRNSDYCDIKTIESHNNLRQFIAGMLSYYPWWIVMLYRIREILVPLLGLVKHPKPEQLPFLRPEEISFTPGESATFFIVHQAKEDTYWVAVTPEDKHLSAFFGVIAEKKTNGVTRFVVFTSIQYRHWTGPVYLNLIRPFHHLAVSMMMKAAATR